MEMLKERDRELCRVHANRRPSHYFNSFFITKLLITDGKYNYSAVARWTKRAKVDIFECEKVYCPVNISNTHWTMLIMYMQKREIHYYDSMSGNGHFYLNGVLKYLEDEHQNKKGTPFDKTGWRLIDREAYVPQQNNGVSRVVTTL
jgi:sentrin-specific protease 1